MSDLIHYIRVSCYIHCTNCGKRDSVYVDDEVYAAEDFYLDGWKATRFGNVYCPKCAKKKLKGEENGK